MIVVVAGNRMDGPDRMIPRFPTDRVGAVRDRIGRLLDEWQPELVVGAAAAGADLIALSEASRRGIPIHVVLPLPVAVFKSRSVADQGDDWSVLFDEQLTVCDGVTVSDLSDDDQWYIAGNDLILDTAKQLADGRPITSLVVASSSDRGVSHDFRVKSIERGWNTVTLDPLTG